MSVSKCFEYNEVKKVSDLNKNADPLAISVHNPMFKCIKVM